MIRFSQVEAWDCFAYEHLLFNFEDGIHSIEGVNGSAKTSVFMVLEQGLFNRNSKGTRIDEVNNTITGKPYEIKVTFTKTSDEYLVINSRKSGTIEIYKNGKPKHVKRIPDNLKIIEDILGVDFNMFQDLIYQSPKSSINLLERDSDASRKAFLNNILALDEIDESLEKFKVRDKELSGKNGQLETLKAQIRKYEDSIVEDYEKEQDEIDLSSIESAIQTFSNTRDDLRADIAKIRTQIATHQEDLLKFDNMKSTLAKVVELEKQLKLCDNPEESLAELSEARSELQLARQSERQALFNATKALATHNENKQWLKRIAEVEEKLQQIVLDDSLESLKEALQEQRNTLREIESTIKFNEKELTNLHKCSTIGVCSTCSQEVPVGLFQDDVERLTRDNALQSESLLNAGKVVAELLEKVELGALREDLQHQLQVLKAHLKEECSAPVEVLERIVADHPKHLEGIDDELTNISQKLDNKIRYDEIHKELASVRPAPSEHLDAEAAKVAIEVGSKQLRTTQALLEETESALAGSRETLKGYLEFNTIQRTIKAVNAQKKAYNDSALNTLEALYKDLNTKEDQAALVKTWLQVLGAKGFRVHKMQTFLGHLNASMKKYSDMLCDGKISCMFYMTEGEIDFTVTDCNKTIAWSCWSEGEKARVKMACLFAVLELLEIMGAVSFNVLALDEIFSALDHSGKEGLFRVLNYRKKHNRSIFTIAHTQLALDKEYDSVVKAYKQEDGTTIIVQ